MADLRPLQRVTNPVTKWTGLVVDVDARTGDVHVLWDNGLRQVLRGRLRAA